MVHMTHDLTTKEVLAFVQCIYDSTYSEEFKDEASMKLLDAWKVPPPPKPTLQERIDNFSRSRSFRPDGHGSMALTTPCGCTKEQITIKVKASGAVKHILPDCMEEATEEEILAGTETDRLVTPFDVLKMHTLSELEEKFEESKKLSPHDLTEKLKELDIKPQGGQDDDDLEPF